MELYRIRRKCLVKNMSTSALSSQSYSTSLSVFRLRWMLRKAFTGTTSCELCDNPVPLVLGSIHLSSTPGSWSVSFQQHFRVVSHGFIEENWTWTGRWLRLWLLMVLSSSRFYALLPWLSGSSQIFWITSKLQVPDQKSDLDFTFIMRRTRSELSSDSYIRQEWSFLALTGWLRGSWLREVREQTFITFNYVPKLTGNLLFYSLASGEQISKVTLSLSSVLI